MIRFSQSLAGKQRQNTFISESDWLLDKLPQYLHVMHGQNIHATFLPSLHQLRVKRVHDDNGLKNWSLAFLHIL